MFVHGVRPGQPLVLMVKQDEKGLALKDAVLKKCPSIPSSFILMHQGRKVIKKYGKWQRRDLAGIQIEITLWKELICTFKSLLCFMKT